MSTVTVTLTSGAAAVLRHEGAGRHQRQRGCESEQFHLGSIPVVVDAQRDRGVSYSQWERYAAGPGLGFWPDWDSCCRSRFRLPLRQEAWSRVVLPSSTRRAVRAGTWRRR